MLLPLHVSVGMKSVNEFAGLQLARVLATHANNPDGARKLLAQMAQLYPADPQPGQLIKQLGLQ